MVQRPSLQTDLTHLFSPAINDGPESPLQFQKSFELATQRLNDMRAKGLLGYSELPFDNLGLEQIITAAQKYKTVKNVIVFGIGGSALGAHSISYALRGTFGTLNQAENFPRLFVIDHIEPTAFMELTRWAHKGESLFVVISKSGNTSETLAQYLYLKEHFKDVSDDQIFIITDPQSGFLRDFAKDRNYPTLPVPQNVGGRFSVFSAVGLFPLAVSGIDVASLLEGARNMEEHCRQTNLIQNPAALMALSWYHWLKEKGMSQVVMMPYSDRLRYFSDWFAQLFGESLGKRYRDGNNETCVGFTPIKATGVTDQHSQLQLYLEGPRDKLISFVDVDHYENPAALSSENFDDERIDFLTGKSLAELMKAEKKATQESLRENHRPNQTISLHGIDEYQLGQLYQLFMNVVPYLGALMDINPFDQPAVERIKRLTFGLMGRKGFEDEAAHFREAGKNPLISVEAD